MPKLLIFSDTHGSSKKMIDIISNENDVHACFHLGDGAKDCDKVVKKFPWLALYQVQGNCDFSSALPYDAIAPFGGLLIFYTHGHSFNVKHGFSKLAFSARRKSADIALFGHTHAPFNEKLNNVQLFNPGSLTMPKHGIGTYGIIYIENGEASFEIAEYGE